MILNGLEQLINGMRNNSTNTVNVLGKTMEVKQVALKFDYRNGKGDFAVIVRDLKPIVITFAKKKSSPPKYISFEINDDYSIQTKLEYEKYKLLKELLGIEYSEGSETFRTSSFFEHFSNNIPLYADTVIANQLDNAEHFNEYVRVEDSHKTKFLDFKKNNGTTKNVTEENLNKTRLYYGDEVAKLCEKENGNISSWWEEP